MNRHELETKQGWQHQGSNSTERVQKPILESTNKNETVVNHNHFRFSEVKNCDMCEVVFLSQPLLNEHIHQFHTENKTEEVQNTDQTSGDIIQLHCALEESSPSTSCEFQCSSRNQLKKHIDLVHRIKTLLQCTLCTLTFKNIEDMSQHINMVHRTKEDTICNICGQYYEDELNEHINRKHMQLPFQSPPNINQTKSRLSCRSCNVCYETKPELQRHNYENHKSYKPCRNFATTICNNDEYECSYNHTILQENEVICYRCGDKFNRKKPPINTH